MPTSYAFSFFEKLSHSESSYKMWAEFHGPPRALGTSVNCLPAFGTLRHTLISTAAAAIPICIKFRVCTDSTKGCPLGSDIRVWFSSDNHTNWSLLPDVRQAVREWADSHGPLVQAPVDFVVLQRLSRSADILCLHID
jgi:hypothetical protein